jgi:hypothetical protein
LVPLLLLYYGSVFKVPWENVFGEPQRLCEHSEIQMPRVGADLLQMVQVVL